MLGKMKADLKKKLEETEDEEERQKLLATFIDQVTKRRFEFPLFCVFCSRTFSPVQLTSSLTEIPPVKSLSKSTLIQTQHTILESKLIQSDSFLSQLQLPVHFRSL